MKCISASPISTGRRNGKGNRSGIFDFILIRNGRRTNRCRQLCALPLQKTPSASRGPSERACSTAEGKGLTLTQAHESSLQAPGSYDKTIFSLTRRDSTRGATLSLEAERAVPRVDDHRIADRCDDYGDPRTPWNPPFCPCPRQ